MRTTLKPKMPPHPRYAAPLIALLASAPIATAQSCGTPWTTYQGASPSPRYNAAIAYDSSRGRVVLFGGYNAGYLGDTWEWTASGPGGGGTWSQVATSGPPPAMAAGMAYDSVRHRTVLFGGYTGTINPSQTWEWDGSSWSLMQSVQSPPYSASLIAGFDPVRGRTVMIIDNSSPQYHGETWEYDGASWTRSAESTPFVDGEDDSMVFDAARSVMVAIASGNGSRNLWERSPSGWQQVSSDMPVHPYSACFRLVFDSGLGKPVFLDGDISSGPTSVWAWNASTGHWWVMNTNGPPFAERAAVVYDAAGSQVLQFGGSHQTLTDATWLARTNVTSGPIITFRPLSLGLLDHWFAGSLHVDAVGSGTLSFQWRRNGQFIADGGAYSGATTPDLLINPINSGVGGGFDVVITDQCGSTISPAVSVGVGCYANCDLGIQGYPILNANDFQCFINHFAAGDSYANCDMSTAPPVLNANDFQCFMNRYAAGCT